MFQKESFSIPSDSSGIYLVKIIQTRRCGTTRHATTGHFLRVVIKNIKVSLKRRRKKKSRSICIRSKMFFYKNDQTSFRYSDNALVVLKKRMNVAGREIYGPTSKNLKIKKFKIAFQKVF